MVVQFYKRNAGLLFFFFIVFFGVIPPHYLLTTHLALINAQIDSVLLTAFVFVLWTSYSIRCTNFIQLITFKYWDSATNLYRAFPRRSSHLVLLLTFTLIFLPVSSYGVLVAFVAFHKGALIYGAYVIVVLLLITITNAIYAFRVYEEKKLVLGSSHKKPQIKRKKFKFNWLLLSYFWHEKRTIILIMKITSYVGFNLFIIRNSDFFRKDYFSLFILLLGSLNSLLIFTGQKFLEEYAQFLRNLPISVIRRGIMILITGVIYFVPELLFLIGMDHEILTYESKLLYYGLLFSHFTLLFSLLYSENFSFWKFIKYIFVMLLGYQILISLFPIYVVIIFNLTLGFAIFNDGFLKYEHETSLMKE